VAVANAPLPDTIVDTYVMLQEGVDVEEIASRRGLKSSTVWTHIERLAREQFLDESAIEVLIPAALRERIEAALSQSAPEAGLKAVYETLGGDVDYELIRCIAAWRNGQAECRRGHIMKVVILAGGLGTRLAEETEVKPKPMVEIGGRPILWHIMKSYAAHGFCEFFVALGYKGEVIKRYFVDMLHFKGSMSLDFVQGEITMHQAEREDWIVHLMDTGLETGTGGRIKRLESHLRHETFMMTYGDGVSNVNMQQLLAFHRGHGKTATITAVRPPARFGGLELHGDFVSHSKENRKSPHAGSTAAFWLSSRACSITLKAIRAALRIQAVS
jgi:glucose-1-phosphate cytidylyltransferase